MGSKGTCPKKIATEKQVKPKNQLAPYRTWDRNTSAPPIPTKKQKSTIRLLLNNEETKGSNPAGPPNARRH